MEILYTLPRHHESLEKLRAVTRMQHMSGSKYLCVAIDGPDSVNRQASFASDFNYEDTHKLFAALAEQTK